VCDRSGSGAAFLVRALYGVGYETREPSAWLVEGLLYYLTEATVYALLSTVSALAATRSRIGVDLVNRDLLTSPTIGPLLGAFAQRSGLGRFGAKDPEELFAGHGWEAEVAQPGEPGANYGRWSYPVIPPGTGRSSTLLGEGAVRVKDRALVPGWLGPCNLAGNLLCCAHKLEEK
jgi:O-methyltransferase involved in polyketide biosynthesis